MDDDVSPVVSELEEEFGVKLPRDYVQLLHDYPDILLKPIMSDWPKGGSPSDCWFLKDITRIVDLNRAERLHWPEREWTRGRGFPSHLFLIGEEDGDLYALNTRTAKVAAVAVWRHEWPIGVWMPYAFTLNSFVRKCARRCT